MNNAPEVLLYKWLRRLRYNVSKTLIRNRVLSHSDYPSLLCITDTLSFLGISHNAIYIEHKDLVELPLPFLAHVDINGGTFILVDNLAMLDKEDKKSFYQKWDGIVVVADFSEAWTHKLNMKHLAEDRRKRMSKILAISFSFLLIMISICFIGNLMANILLLIASVGVFTSYLIICLEAGMENKLTSAVCGKSDSCDEVIQSKVITMPGKLKLGDVSIIWFATMFLGVVLASFSGTIKAVLSLLSLFSVVGIVISMISVFYQAIIIKAWCRLCMVVATLLVLQFIVLLPELQAFSYTSLTTYNIFFFIFLFFIVAAFWLLLSGLWEKERDLFSKVMEAKRFKYNEEVFGTLLHAQKKVDTTPWNDDLQLGCPSASVQVLVVCSPYCRPCADVHHTLEEILQVHGDHIGVTIRFAVSLSRTDKRLEAVASILSYLAENSSSMNMREKAMFIRSVLHRWYNNVDRDEFLKYSDNLSHWNIRGLLEKHEHWAEGSRISHTPTIFINGYELPYLYSISDLSDMLIELIGTSDESSSKTKLLYDSVSV